MKHWWILIFLIGFIFFCSPLIAEDTENSDTTESDKEDDAAEEEEITIDDDFIDDFVIEEDISDLEKDKDTNDESKTENGKSIEIGGFLDFFVKTSWDYNDEFDFNEDNLDVSLKASLFFDSRPDEDFRVFGKVKISSPFLSESDYQIFELFSDFNWDNRLFFRAGKHTIKWGVGYFFSPADVLNLVSIDPQYADDEREGPISLKVNFPFSIHNLYLYIIMNEIEKPEQISIAPKIEFLLGNFEFGIGGFYNSELAPRGVVTLTTTLFNFDIFSECVVQYDSDKTFLRNTDDLLTWPIGVETFKRNKEFFILGTIGFLYFQTNPDITFLGQYFYNGEGYEDSTLLESAYSLRYNNLLTDKDLEDFGQHYCAASFSYDDIFDSGFGITLYFMSNLSDQSILISPSISLTIIDEITATLGLTLFLGDDGDEIYNQENPYSIYLEVNTGSGLF